MTTRMTHTIQDGVRMVGQLLLHHPTIGTFARDREGTLVEYTSPKASCFCVWGAIGVVANALKLNEQDLYRSVSLRFAPFCTHGYTTMVRIWDHSTAWVRHDIAAALASV